MKFFRSSNTSLGGIISIILIYIILIILIVLFSVQILRDMSVEGSLGNFIVMPVAIVLPIFLIGTIVYNIVRLLKERASNKPGIRFKIRLMIFFTFIAVLSSIPQGVLSLNFIYTAINSWFDSNHYNALKGGLEIALDYNTEKISNLNFLGESRILSRILQDIEKLPERVWENIHGANINVDSMQVFDRNGNEVCFYGDTNAKIDSERLEIAEEGILSRIYKEDVSVLYYLRRIKLDGEIYNVVLSTIVPSEFNKKAENLRNSMEFFKGFEKVKKMFRYILILIYFYFSFPILLLSILVSFTLSEEIIRPIVNLEEATKRVADGDFTFRILSRPGNELSFLISSFNKMVLELEHSRQKIAQTQKITAWQEIARRMAHEIKNPLTPIKLSAERILRKYNEKKEDMGNIIESAVSVIMKEVGNLNSLLNEFRDLARLPAPRMKKANISIIVREVIESYRDLFHGIVFNIDGLDKDLELSIDKNQIERVFTNLFINASESIEGKGTILVRNDLVKKGNRQYSRLQIQDTGAGILKENQEVIFNPYFTTKMNGTGLGLAIVERIIFDHKGQIWFETQVGIGTTFFIDLPVME